jgi:glycosyltransferase involved in cell wall biosynthesis
MKRVAIIQRYLPCYRVGVFEELSKQSSLVCQVFLSTDQTGDKAKTCPSLPAIHYLKTFTFSLCVFGRRMHISPFLLYHLFRFDPDIIIFETESHPWGTWISILYTVLHLRKVKLIPWCFYALPGKKNSVSAALYKKVVRSFCDHYISYSSFGKNYLCNLGIPSSKITTACNTANTNALEPIRERLASANTSLDNNYIRLSSSYNILWSGSVLKSKNFDLFLDIADAFLQFRDFKFLVAGDGHNLDHYKRQVEVRKLDNIIFLGSLSQHELAIIYTLSDILLIPGRGGIVISESLFWGTPVVVHQGDGTEYDFITNPLKGVITHDLSIESFTVAIKDLCRPLNKDKPMSLLQLKPSLLDMNSKIHAQSILSALVTV